MRIRSWFSLAVTLVSFAAAALRAAAPACSSVQTYLVSTSTSGTVGNDDSSQQDINEDGRYVLFRSHATDIVSYPVNRPLGTNVYLRDRSNGSVQVLDDHAPGQGFNDQAAAFALSGDGHSAAFDTLANNVAPGVTDTNGKLDVYVKNFQTGAFTRATVPDSSITATTQSLHNASPFSINRDGRYVAFVSSGLVFSPEYYTYPESPSTFFFHIYVRDLVTNHTYLVTRGVNGQGQPAPLNGQVSRPVLSANGQLLVFTTDSTNLRGFSNPTGRRDVYVATFNGSSWDVTERIPAGTSGIDWARQSDISVSPDGRYVAYVANVSGAGELFVHDRQSATSDIQVRPASTPPRPAGFNATNPRLGYDTIAWQDYDLTAEGKVGAFWVHLPTGVLQRVGREVPVNGYSGPACCGSNGNTGEAGGVALSADGKWATYNSASPRIVTPDGNGTYDVFVQRMTAAADFTFSCSSLACTFDATPTQSACAVTSYSWSFGDTSNGSGAIATHTYATAGQRSVTLTVVDVNGVQSSVTKLVTPMAGAGAPATRYVALTPCRLWDTRIAPNTRIASGQELILNVVNPPNCSPNPNARAVSLNVTVVAPDGEGYLSAYAPGAATVTAALNFKPATSPRGNNMIVPVAANGTIALKPVIAGAATDLVVDIGGYFTDAPAAGVTPLGFQSLTPCRLYDSRSGGGAPYTSGEIRNVTVQGNCGIPSGAAAASLNAAVVSPTAQGYLTLFAARAPLPLVGNLNYNAMPTGAIANGARVTLAGATPDLGTLMGVAAGGTAHLVVDTNGYFKSDAPLQYTPITPCRALDTRLAAQGPALQSGETRTVQIRGNCGVPSDAKAAMVNITVVGPTAAGHLIAFPSGTTIPLAAAINFAAGETALGNGAITPLSSTATNDLSLYAFISAPGNTTHVVIDVFGYFR